MTPQNNRPSGNRRRGQSGRNRRPNSGNGSPRNTSAEPRRPEKPKSFLEKLIAFFTGGSQKPKTHATRPSLNSRPAITAEDRQERQRTRGSSSRGESSRSESARGESSPARSEESERRSSRKPELVEVSSPKLYVGNLSFDATESDLSELFNGVGSVQTAEVVSHRDTQRSKGFAFVTMTSVEEAQRAVLELHDKDFMGRKLVVSGAKTSDVRSYTPTER